VSARLGLVLCMLAGGCLHLPPELDDTSMATEPVAPESTPPPTTPTPAPVATHATAPGVAKPLKTCPLVTNRNGFCEGRRVCTRDLDGCETCKCNAELDSGRARFEHMNPWDMRQR
jgi:hypothetical protein